MAELAAIGLVSNIISFIDFSVEFGQLVQDVAQAHGQLPRELEECREHVDAISTWLADIKRNLMVPARLVVEVQGDEEDVHLEAAILRCVDTVNGLIKLLSSLGGTVAVGTEQGVATGTAPMERIRDGVRSVKRAGKIVWRKDEMREMRDRLRENRDHVHACIASRTGRKVGQLREEQKEVAQDVQDMRSKFDHAIIKIESLESQNHQLVMISLGVQASLVWIGYVLINPSQIQKFDLLLAVMQRDRGNKFAEIFEFVPPQITVSQIMEQMQYVFHSVKSRLLRSQRPSGAQFNQLRSGPSIFQIESMPSSRRSALTVRVILDDGRSRLRGQASPRILDLAADDVQDSFRLAQALYQCQAETLSSFKATTKVTFVRFYRNGTQLSILNVRDSEVLSEFTSGPRITPLDRALPSRREAEAATDDVDGITELGNLLDHSSSSAEQGDIHGVNEHPLAENPNLDSFFGSQATIEDSLSTGGVLGLLATSPRWSVYDELQRIGREEALGRSEENNPELCIYYFNGFGAFLADPKAALQFVLEVLHYKESREVVSGVLLICMCYPAIFIAIGEPPILSTCILLVLILSCILLLHDHIRDLLSRFTWTKETIIICHPYILFVASSFAYLSIIAILTKELMSAYGIATPVFAVLLLVPSFCGQLLVLTLDTRLGECLQWAFLLLILRTALLDDFLNRWKPYVATMAVSTMVTFIIGAESVEKAFLVQAPSSITQTMRLEDIGVETFGVLVHWIYANEIKDRLGAFINDNGAPDFDYVTLAKV
ncbi:hypothetical protein IFR05_016041 [Cadophora sp. M221]|nr:hypothetical protein IFR05_016041 [Cadophora sp. M221]